MRAGNAPVVHIPVRVRLIICFWQLPRTAEGGADFLQEWHTFARAGKTLMRQPRKTSGRKIIEFNTSYGVSRGKRSRRPRGITGEEGAATTNFITAYSRLVLSR